MASEKLYNVEGSPYQSISGYEIPGPSSGTGDAIVSTHWRSPYKLKVIVRVYAMVPRQNISDMCGVALRIDVKANDLPT